MYFKILILLFIPLFIYSNQKIDEINIAYYHDDDILANYKNSKSALDIWIKDFAKKLDKNVNMVLYENKKKFLDDYVTNKLDVMPLYAYFYLFDKDIIDQNTADYWHLSKVKNKPFQKMYLIVNKKSGIKNIVDLKDKNIALNKRNLFAKFYFEKIFLESTKKNIDSMMSKINYNKKNSLLLQVYFGKYDAAVITSNEYDVMLELNPAIDKKIKILKTSPEIFPHMLIFYNKKNTSNKMKFFKKSLNAFLINEDNNELFELLKVEEFKRIEKKDLDKLYEYYQSYKKLKSKYK